MKGEIHIHPNGGYIHMYSPLVRRLLTKQPQLIKAYPRCEDPHPRPIYTLNLYLKLVYIIKYIN